MILPSRETGLLHRAQRDPHILCKIFTIEFVSENEFVFGKNEFVFLTTLVVDQTINLSIHTEKGYNRRLRIEVTT